MIACQSGNFDIVRYLIEEIHADPLLHDKEMISLHYAALGRNLDIVRYLIEHEHIQADFCIKKGKTPLYFAVKGGNQEVIEYLITQHNANDQIIVNRMNLLMVACSYCNIQTINYFIEQRHFDMMKKIKGQIPYQFAFLHNKIEVIKYLIETYKIDINSICKDGKTLFLLSIENLNKNVPLELAKLENCDIFAKCERENDNTALHQAARFNNVELMKYLIKRGLNLKEVNKTGQTPLHVASFYGSMDVVEYLIEDEKVDVNEINQMDKNLPIHYAVMEQKYRVIKYLIDKDAKMFKENKNGLNAVDLAEINGRSIKMLMKEEDRKYVKDDPLKELCEFCPALGLWRKFVNTVLSLIIMIYIAIFIYIFITVLF